MDITSEIILKSIKDRPIGETENFLWFITDIGIVALIKDTNLNLKKFKAEDEALGIALDLSKEEREFYKINGQKFILYYS